MRDVLYENMKVLEPMMRTPFTDKMGLLHSSQGRPCGYFETQFYRCMEAYGRKLGRLHCDLEHRDFSECLTKRKQYMRQEKIRAHRHRLFMEGKIDRPYEANHPEYGQCQPDWFSHNRIK